VGLFSIETHGSGILKTKNTYPGFIRGSLDWENVKPSIIGDITNPSGVFIQKQCALPQVVIKAIVRWVNINQLSSLFKVSHHSRIFVNWIDRPLFTDGVLQK
jgi:hypothetical protein